MEFEMSKTYRYRKIMKPMLERKRRARINKCLDELKDLMVEYMMQEGENVARLEKADILELTVDHIRKLQRGRPHSRASSESFRSGFVHAANEVSRALASLPRVDITLGTALMTHLGKRLNQIQPQIEQQVLPAQPATTMVNRVSPLKVQCGNVYPGQLSPAPSSGYGSDYEYQSSTKFIKIAEQPKRNLWRPW